MEQFVILISEVCTLLKLYLLSIPVTMKPDIVKKVRSNCYCWDAIVHIGENGWSFNLILVHVTTEYQRLTCYSMVNLVCTCSFVNFEIPLLDHEEWDKFGASLSLKML